MKSIFTCLALFFLFLCHASSPVARDYGAEYIEKWKNFYPSKALDRGIHASIFQYENYSPASVEDWLAFNKSMLESLSDPAAAYGLNFPIDSRLLKVQIREEIGNWELKEWHRHRLSLYSALIDQATDEVLEADFLTPSEKARVLCQRLESVQQLCAAAKISLISGEKTEIERGLKQLLEAAVFYEKELPKSKQNGSFASHCQDFTVQCQTTAGHIHALIHYIEEEILPGAKKENPVLGRTEYARRLALYTDSSLSPEQLSGMALKEVETVRKLIGEVSLSYLKKQYPDQDLPETYEAIVRRAFADMEKDAPVNGAEYLSFWQELSASAIQFIEDHHIATLPEQQSLRILTAPESAGPAARIGWVDSAAPFAPNPLTTLYLPSIPESFPEKEKREFWASFNKPFNRMIVIHELFPGHYMQIKISRETPHPVRLLFPYAVYFEGWATFCERVLLDAGWEADRPLTFLAHLRKRLENANRAYTSIQVHCNGWDEEKVMQFSTDTALLAPQFAKSLWGRIIRSPLQLTSYFLGGQQFSELLQSEKKRLGKAFNLRVFMDTVMRIGPVPIDEFSGIFRQME